MEKKILDYSSKEEREEYEHWKEEIAKTKFDGNGTSQLLKRLQKLENSQRQDQFLDALSEFNLAILLKKAGIKFQYEKLENIDFFFDDIAVEVKSIREKEYQQEEQEKANALNIGESYSYHEKNSGISIKKSSYKFGEIESYSIERSETTPGGLVPMIQMKQNRNILEEINKFEEKNTNQKIKKVMLFVSCNHNFSSHYFKYIAERYLQNRIYEDDFYEYDRVHKFKRNIKSFICISGASRPLLWNKSCYKYDRLRIWANNLELEMKIKNLFK